MASDLPRLIGVSGPLQGQIFTVDEAGVRPSEECIVKLCDGRVVACSVRDGQESPWRLMDHDARVEIGSSEFRLEHREFDPEVVYSLFEVEDEEIERFFLGLVMGKTERPVAAAVLLDDWNPGETSSATFLPGFFYPRYSIINRTRRKCAPNVYDETENVFCARLSFKDRYIGALYVKSLAPAPFRTEERLEITRLAGLLAMYIHSRESWLREPANQSKLSEEEQEEQRQEKMRRRISRPAELEVVFLEPTPAYRFGCTKEQPLVEQVPSSLETLFDGFLSDIFDKIPAAVAAAVCLQVPEEPLHFVVVERGDDLEIDKDVVYRAFMMDVDAARNAEGSAWAVPLIQHNRRIGVMYVELKKAMKVGVKLTKELQAIADISGDLKFPENLDRFL